MSRIIKNKELEDWYSPTTHTASLQGFKVQEDGTVTTGMDNTHKENLKQLLRLFETQATAKYEKGVNEHGGHLWRKGVDFLIDAAYEEAVDQVIYLGQLKQILNGIEGDK